MLQMTMREREVKIAKLNDYSYTERGDEVGGIKTVILNIFSIVFMKNGKEKFIVNENIQQHSLTHSTIFEIKAGGWR